MRAPGGTMGAWAEGAGAALATQVADAVLSDDDAELSSASTCSLEACPSAEQIVRNRILDWIVDLDGAAISLSGRGIVAEEATAMIGMRTELARKLSDELLRPGATVQSVVAVTQQFEAEFPLPYSGVMREQHVGVRLVTRQQAAQFPPAFSVPVQAVAYLGGVGQHAILCTHAAAYPLRGARLLRLLREAAECGLLQPVAWAAERKVVSPPSEPCDPEVPIVLERDFEIVRELLAALDAHELWVPIAAVREALCAAAGYFAQSSRRSTEQSVSFVVRKCLKFTREQTLRELKLDYHDDALWLDAAAKQELRNFLLQTLTEMKGATHAFKVRWHVSRSSRARAKSTTPGADRRALRMYG